MYERTNETKAEASTFTPLPGRAVQRTLACGRTPGLAGGALGDEHQPALRRSPGGQAEHSTVPPVVHEVLNSPGQPLDTAARSEMEASFGHDFSRVRVHAGEEAARSAAAVGALAYTVGQDMVFGAGQYAPHTSEGRKILAHELTHTLQQGAAAPQLAGDLKVSDPESPAEREAHEVADAVASGREASSVSRADAGVARQDEPTPAGPATPAAPTKKKVTVNVVNMSGATASIGTALTYANTKVYNQANVEVEKGKEVTLDEAKSKAILGDDLILEEYTSPATPTGEEKKLLAENQTSGAITLYFVKGFDKGSLGEAFWASGGSGLIGVVVGVTRPDNTFSHELGHVLLDDGSHNVPDATYLMHATAPDPTKLTPEQIKKIQASPFVK